MLAVVLLSEAAAPPPTLAPSLDQLDYVFFASDRPVRIRLHVRMGDRPYDVAWHEFMDRLFAWFDKNNNGSLDSTEAARLMPGNFLVNQLSGSIGGSFPSGVPMAVLDTNKDGKVSKEEFKAYYRQNGAGPLRFFYATNTASTARQTNETIWKRIDTDRDGKLTQTELARLEPGLRSLDENEDELLTQAELNTDMVNPGYEVFGGAVPVMAAPTVEPGLIEIKHKGPHNDLATQLVARYDRNKDGKLGREEIAFDRALFDKLDHNLDGYLDAGEMIRFFSDEPDLIFRASVGTMTRVGGLLGAVGLSGGQKRLEQLSSAGKGVAKSMKRANADSVGFELGDTRFSVQASQGQPVNINNTRAFYLRQFTQIVGTSKKDYVERSQQKDFPQNPFVFQIFTQADRNNDGKLTRVELNAYFDVLNQGGGAHVALQVSDQGRSLFSVIDADGDGRLSLRELRSAWTRIKPLSKDGKGVVVGDLPRTLQIALAQGNIGGGPRPVPAAVFGGPTPPPMRRTTSNVPAWFSRMDANGDGDISPKEWLGTTEEFRQIDTDGDGLISAEEARQYEARLKKEK